MSRPLLLGAIPGSRWSLLSLFSLGGTTCMKFLSLCLLLSAAIQSVCCADVSNLSGYDRKVLLDASRFHEVRITANLPPTILALCDGGGTPSSQNQARHGTPLMPSPTQLFQASASSGQRSAAIITSCIMSAAESRTRFTFWLPNSRSATPNRK
jgi:hypothetical protein